MNMDSIERFENYPTEILLNIFQYLSPRDLILVGLTCQKIRVISVDNILWKPIWDNISFRFIRQYKHSQVTNNTGQVGQGVYIKRYGNRQLAKQILKNDEQRIKTVAEQLLTDCKEGKRTITESLKLALAVNAPSLIIDQLIAIYDKSCPQKSNFLPNFPRDVFYIAVERVTNREVIESLISRYDAFDCFLIALIVNPEILNKAWFNQLKNVEKPLVRFLLVTHILKCAKQQDAWETAFEQELTKRCEQFEFNKKDLESAIRRAVIGSYPDYESFNSRTHFLNLPTVSEKVSESTYLSYVRKFKEYSETLERLAMLPFVVSPPVDAILIHADGLLTLEDPEEIDPVKKENAHETNTVTSLETETTSSL